MARKTIKAVIFDMDGVLVNTEPCHIAIERNLFGRLGLKISEEEHLRYLGKSSFQMWVEIIRNHSLSQSPAELASMNSEEIIRYFSAVKEIETMPGIREFLGYLSAKPVPLAVASSSESNVINLLLSKTGLLKYFKHTVGIDTVGKSKPEPDIYLYTAALLSVEPANCLVIEDSPNGIKAARSAGMYCVAYRGVTPSPPDQSEADEIINDFRLLKPVIEEFSAY
jgi:HAD superfamily hydrolase (TIGR01509 family)